MSLMERIMANRLFKTLTALATGAAALYFLDKEKGKERREMAQEKAGKLWREASDEVDTVAKDAANRLQDVRQEASARLEKMGVTDEALKQRINTAVENLIADARELEVQVEKGLVTLRGKLPMEEIDKVVDRIKALAGVKDVDNQLDVQPAPKNTRNNID
jgi:osmotically-inducible protein OsmY